MDTPNSDYSRSNIASIALRTLKLAWLPIVVFVAFDLSVSEEMSILRSDPPARLQTTIVSGSERPADPVVPQGDDVDAVGSAHSYFGIEEDTARELNGVVAPGEAVAATALGEWSGRFAGVLAGDADADCWSAYDFDLVLNEIDAGVTGSGSYWVDPASCSSHGDRYVAFVDANGKRTGNRVNIRITGSGDGQAELVFDGLIMTGRLTGWFYSPEGKPVSGPVVLARK